MLQPIFVALLMEDVATGNAHNCLTLLKVLHTDHAFCLLVHSISECLSAKFSQVPPFDALVQFPQSRKQRVLQEILRGIDLPLAIAPSIVAIPPIAILIKSHRFHQSS
jgi:hypothetical protein